MKFKKEEVIFAAVDRKYFRKYAAAWAWSIFENNMHGHLHVIDPQKQDLNKLVELSEVTKGKVQFSTGDIESNFPKDKCYFASFRFLYLNELYGQYKKVLVTDIDSIFMKEIKFPDGDFGFFHRDPLDTEDKWFKESSKIAAGIFFISLNKENEKQFSSLFKSSLESLNASNSWRWMVDQNALSSVFENLTSDQTLRFYQFTYEDFSWDFDEISKIWTGKGERKWKSRKYVREFKKFRRRYKLEKLKNYLKKITLFH